MLHMEDIPEESESNPAPPSPPSQGQREEYKFLEKFYTGEWLFAILTFGFPFGWDMSGFPSCIELACACWSITLLIALHIIWVSTKKLKTNSLLKILRLLIIFLIPVVIVAATRKPIINQYRIQHSPPQETEIDVPRFSVLISNDS
jgi:hypothetical protein